MKIFFITFIIALILVLVCGIFLGIGKLLTGKSKLKCKRCGEPEKKDSCQVCEKNQPKRLEHSEKEKNSDHPSEGDS